MNDNQWQFLEIAHHSMAAFYGHDTYLLDHEVTTIMPWIKTLYPQPPFFLSNLITIHTHIHTCIHARTHAGISHLWPLQIFVCYIVAVVAEVVAVELVVVAVVPQGRWASWMPMVLVPLQPAVLVELQLMSPPHAGSCPFPEAALCGAVAAAAAAGADLSASALVRLLSTTCPSSRPGRCWGRCCCRRSCYCYRRQRGRGW